MNNENENMTLDPETAKVFDSVINFLTYDQKEKCKVVEDAKELCDTLGKMGIALPDELFNKVA